MRVMVMKFARWNYEVYYESEHPEYAAIRNLVSQNPQHDFILVGEGPKYEHFRYGKTLFYNLGTGNKVKYFLNTFLRFMLPLLSGSSVVVVFGAGGFLVSPGIASLLTGARFVLVVVGDIRYSLSSFPKLIRSLFKSLLKATFRKSAAILVISESIRREIRDDYELPLNKVVTYDYRISDIFNQRVPSDLKKTFNPCGPVVLTVARISPEKGLHYLVEASRTIIEKVPNVRFVIQPYSSEENYKKCLMSMIRKHHLEKYFKIFTEEAPYSEIPRYMVAADVFVLPSITEGKSTALLEALASGVPVVASRVGGIPDTIVDGYNGLLVEPAAVKNLAESIVKVLLDEKLRRKLSKGAIATIRRSTESEFEDLLKKSIFPKSKHG